MRNLGLAMVAALALAACGQGGGAGDGGEAGGGGGAASSVFPNLFQAAYRAEATVTAPETGQTIPVVMIRDGQRFRMELNGPQGAMAIVHNPDANETFTIINAGGRQMAMRSANEDITDPNGDWANASAGATFVGPCSGAGQTGAEWTRTDADGVNNTCVTQDGIILRATKDGQTVWETTSVSRGPQDASLFALPAGVQVMDLNNLGGTFKIPGQ